MYLSFSTVFVVVPHIEVVVTALPESNLSRPLEFSPHLLLQNLQDGAELKSARFADQQMHVFGHDDVAGDDEAVALPHPLQFLLKDAVSVPRFEQGLSSIATEVTKWKFAVCR
jgi:hypothetical protein